MEYVGGGTTQYLLAVNNLERSSRVYNSGRRILKCFRVMDLGYFVTGLALTVSCVKGDNKSENNMFGGVLLGFTFLSAACNALALRGLDIDNRSYLIPWLILYPWVMSFLIIGVVHKLWITDFHLELYQVQTFISIF